MAGELHTNGCLAACTDQMRARLCLLRPWAERLPESLPAHIGYISQVTAWLSVKVRQVARITPESCDWLSGVVNRASS